MDHCGPHSAGQEVIFSDLDMHVGQPPTQALVSVFTQVLNWDVHLLTLQRAWHKTTVNSTAAVMGSVTMPGERNENN